MKNTGLIFISILRFFKSNIFSLIGLMLLVFFSTGIFTTLNNTSSNLTSSYNNIKTKGNLHDLVINENFSIGEAAFDVAVTRDTVVPDSFTYSFTIKVDHETQKREWTQGHEKTFKKFEEWIKSQKDNTTNKYDIFFNNNEKLFLYFKDSSGKFIAKPSIQSDSLEAELLNMPPKVLAETIEEATQNAKAILKDVLLSPLNNIVSKSISFIFKDVLKTKIKEETGNELLLREFNALDVSTNMQGKYFKIIESNPENIIDNIVIFNGNNISKQVDFSEFINNLYSEFLSKGDVELGTYLPSITSNPYKPTTGLSTEDKILVWTWKLIFLLTDSDWGRDEIIPGAGATDLLFRMRNKIKDLKMFEKINPWSNDQILENELMKITLSSKDSKDFINLFKEAKNFLKKAEGYDLINKNYNVIFNRLTGLLPIIGSINDNNSFEVVTTPSYFKNNIGKEPIKKDDWLEAKSLNEKGFKEWLKNLDQKHIMEIDNLKFVIMGSGVSPDFMYPIVNITRPVPDQKSEELAYLGGTGYLKMIDGFRGSPFEKFQVGKMVNGIGVEDAIRISNELSQGTETDAGFMSWPTGILSTYSNNDLNNTLSPASNRVIFIPQIVSSIQVISLFLTGFISLLTLVVISIMIKRFIEMNKSDLAILLANGFKRWELALPLTMLILLITGIATTVGIIIGIALQGPALILFAAFWTLPTSISPLTATFFFSLFGAMMLIFGTLSAIFSFSSLKGEVVELMKDDTKYRFSKLSRIIKRTVRKRSVLTIFRVSLAFSSPWKIISLSSMSAIVMGSISFGISSLNKFDDAAKSTFNSKKYVNAIELYSPTNTGGLYYSIPTNRTTTTLLEGLYSFNEVLTMERFNQLIWNDPTNSNLIIKPESEELIKPVTQNYISKNSASWRNIYTNKLVTTLSATDYNMVLNGNLHLPSISDQTDSAFLMDYLEYKTTSKLSLDHLIAFFVIPWEIASKLMPTNTLSYFNINYVLLLESMYRSNEKMIIGNRTETTSFGEKTFYEALKPFVKFTKTPESEKTTTFQLTYTVPLNNVNVVKPYYLNALNQLTKNEKEGGISLPLAYGFLNNTIGTFSFKLKENFINIIYGAQKIKELNDLSYSMNYKKVPVGEDDETFTTTEFKIIKKNGFNFSSQTLKARGIKENSNFVSLTNGGVDISKSIFHESSNFDNLSSAPVIVNKFAQKTFNLKVGDILTINVLNDLNRFDDKFNNLPEKNYFLKVVGFNDSFKDNEFYFSQKNSNMFTQIEKLQKKITDFPGLPPNLINEEMLYGFNGIFTKSENVVQATSTISLYSPFNLYIGQDKINTPSFSSSLLKNGKGDDPRTKEESNFFIAINRTKLVDKFAPFINDPTRVIPNPEEVDQFINILVNTYGGTSTFVSLLSNLEPVSIINSIFSNVTNMVQTLQWIALIVINIASIIIILLITFIIISDALKLAGILKALGLRSLINASSFLMVYFPVLIIGLLVAIPLTFIINIIYSSIIFNFVGILISAATPWWTFLLAGTSIIIIFLISFLITWRKIKTQKLDQAIK